MPPNILTIMLLAAMMLTGGTKAHIPLSELSRQFSELEGKLLGAGTKGRALEVGNEILAKAKEHGDILGWKRPGRPNRKPDYEVEWVYHRLEGAVEGLLKKEAGLRRSGSRASISSSSSGSLSSKRSHISVNRDPKQMSYFGEFRPSAKVSDVEKALALADWTVVMAGNADALAHEKYVVGKGDPWRLSPRLLLHLAEFEGGRLTALHTAVQAYEQTWRKMDGVGGKDMVSVGLKNMLAMVEEAQKRIGWAAELVSGLGEVVGEKTGFDFGGTPTCVLAPGMTWVEEREMRTCARQKLWEAGQHSGEAWSKEGWGKKHQQYLGKNGIGSVAFFLAKGLSQTEPAMKAERGKDLIKVIRKECELMFTITHACGDIVEYISRGAEFLQKGMQPIERLLNPQRYR